MDGIHGDGNHGDGIETGATSQPHPERSTDPEIPIEASAPNPLHRRPAALVWVFVGGLAGTGLRYAIAEALPTPATGWPTATFVVNLVGAFGLGLLLETNARTGDHTWRWRLRLLAGTGFCGSFTTFSTLALEVSMLGHHGATPLAVGYAVASVAAGFACAWAGIAVAASAFRTWWGEVS